jgi:carbonic anhydrase
MRTHRSLLPATLALALPLFLAGRAALAVAPTATATSQSPIDLRAGDVTFVRDRDLADLKFHYPRRTDLVLVNTGETVRADLPAGAAELRVGRERYELLQFHFHTPSEHLLAGRGTALEMHLVHRSSSGELMVVGVFLEEGEAHADLDALLAAAPEEEGDSTPVRRFALRALLPEERESYRYSGSLTTPPFTEGVRWAVLAEPLEISEETAELVRELFPEGNAREVQPLNQREILSDVEHD